MCTKCRSSGVCQRLPGRGDCLGSFSGKDEFAMETGSNGISDKTQYMQTQRNVNTQAC